MKKITKKYSEIFTVPNLLAAWEEFLSGKKKRRDVVFFQSRLMDNIIGLQLDLKNKSYQHGGYQAFKIYDPKPRDIHKATVRDRLLHHLLYQETYSYSDRQFIHDSYSCRLTKGTHRCLRRLATFARQVSKNLSSRINSNFLFSY
jgi:retron-type reverse transcriptase